jgi:hypothetical protein
MRASLQLEGFCQSLHTSSSLLALKAPAREADGADPGVIGRGDPAIVPPP